MSRRPSDDPPRRQGERPLDRSLLGDPDAGGLAGQGGMTRDDDNQAETEDEDEDED